jgi:probable rRNA maturation factor
MLDNVRKTFMNIHIFQNQSIPIEAKSVEKLVADFTAFHGVRYDEASIHFVDTEAICALHAQFFNDPSTTDCISFPMDAADEPGFRVMGEVFVCPETARDYIKIHGGDIYREITLYVVHGLLHLIGYDDIEEQDRTSMRHEEAKYLEHVQAKKLWIY